MATYERNGVRFEYPDNWALDDRESDESQTAVTVLSPSGAFWTLTVYPPEIDLPPTLRTVLDALAEEYQDLDAQDVDDDFDGQAMVGYDVNFYCLDLTNTALIRGFQTARASFVLLCQAQDRDFADIARVFEAMTTSLVRGALASHADR